MTTPLRRRSSSGDETAAPGAVAGARPVTEPPAGPALRVLFVCTGNICRSAAAERLARSAFEALLGDSVSAIELSSAGTRAVVDADMHPSTAAVVRDLGADTGGFAARQLRRSMITDADLVLTMTRDHRAVVLGLEPTALSRTFTLPEASELARLLDGLDRAVAPDAGPRDLVRRMAAARGRRRSSDADDVLDPIDHPAETHREVGQQIAQLLDPLLRGLVQDLTGRDLLACARQPAPC